MDEKILYQKLLGYNEDFTVTHFEHIVQEQSGEIKIEYTSDYTDESGQTLRGPFVAKRPYVARPAGVE